MVPLLSLFFALRIGSFGAPAEHMRIDVFEEARAAATAAVLRSERADALPWSAPGVPDWVEGPGSRRYPVFHDYRPEEWVSLVASSLHVESSPVGRAAMWVASRPVRVEVSRDRIFVGVRIAGP